MGKLFKIIILISVLFIIIIAAFAALTYYQIKQIMKYVNDKTLEENFQALMKGDCSKLVSIETTIPAIKKTLKFSCINPIIRMLISKNIDGNLCLNIETNYAQLEQVLQQARVMCSNKKDF